ncbi:MAG: 50S ribosomal protein L6 [Bacteroidia bacterium]|nr:50S ribosomal protein L6 [Bacteroidia bacterium]
MSRIGKAPITIPSGVEVKFDKAVVKVKGPKGELEQQLKEDIALEIADGTINVTRPTNQKRHRAMHGLYRSLVANMVQGVHEGFKISLELVGVGFRASNKGQLLDLVLGHSHHVLFALPPEVKVVTETVKGKNPIVHLESHDKQLVGHVAAKIRSFRPPEPYKGKGVKYVGEQLRRKAGKSAAKA